jgi:hypothetical protein
LAEAVRHFRFSGECIISDGKFMDGIPWTSSAKL